MLMLQNFRRSFISVLIQDNTGTWKTIRIEGTFRVCKLENFVKEFLLMKIFEALEDFENLNNHWKTYNMEIKIASSDDKSAFHTTLKTQEKPDVAQIQ